MLPKYYPQLCQMRHTLKIRILKFLGPVNRDHYNRYKDRYNLAIFEACNNFIRPTRRTDVIDKLATAIISDVMRDTKCNNNK